MNDAQSLAVLMYVKSSGTFQPLLMLLMDKSSVLTTHIDIDSNTVGLGEDLYLIT